MLAFVSFSGAQWKRRITMVTSMKMEIFTHRAKLYDVDTIYEMLANEL